MYPLIMSRRDVEELFERIQRAAPTKSQINEGNLIVDTKFHVIVKSSFKLMREEDQAAFARTNKDGFLIALSKDFVDHGFYDHWINLDRRDREHFWRT